MFSIPKNELMIISHFRFFVKTIIVTSFFTMILMKKFGAGNNTFVLLPTMEIPQLFAELNQSKSMRGIS